jgi:hypothetical protein
VTGTVPIGRRHRVVGIAVALLLSIQSCDNPAEPDVATIPSDPFHAALVEQLEALSDPSVDAGRRDAEERIFNALIALFESAESGATNP